MFNSEYQDEGAGPATAPAPAAMGQRRRPVAAPPPAPALRPGPGPVQGLNADPSHQPAIGLQGTARPAANIGLHSTVRPPDAAHPFHYYAENADRFPVSQGYRYVLPGSAEEQQGLKPGTLLDSYGKFARGPASPSYQYDPAAHIPEAFRAPIAAQGGNPEGYRYDPDTQSLYRHAGGGDDAPAPNPAEADSGWGTADGRTPRAWRDPAAAQPPDFNDPAVIRDSLLRRIESQMRDSHTAGDFETLTELAAQRGALDHAGFEGLTQYQHKSALARAQREQLGARTDVLRARADQADPFTDPDRMYEQTLIKTGNPALAEAAAQRAEIAKRNKIGVQTGQPPAVDPNVAQTLLDSKYQTVSHLFGAKDGTPNFELPELFEHVQAIAPPGWDDPKSELAQAMAARIRSLYGTGLQKQLWVPTNPNTFAPLGRGVPHAATAPLWMNNLLLGISPGPENVFANGFRSPTTSYHRRASAANWYSLITGQPQRHQ